MDNLERGAKQERAILRNCPSCGVVLQLGMTESELREFTHDFRQPATDSCPSCGTNFDIIYDRGICLVSDAKACVKRMILFQHSTPWIVGTSKI